MNLRAVMTRDKSYQRRREHMCDMMTPSISDRGHSRNSTRHREAAATPRNAKRQQNHRVLVLIIRGSTNQCKAAQ